MTTSLVTQRVFYDEIDISVNMADFRNHDYDVNYTAGEYIHIGTNFPFNNVWVELTKNANHTPGAPVIEVWWANAWHQVVDVIDGTAGMQQSGRISWALDIDKGWDIERKSADVGLPATSIYNRYWLRMSWAAHYDSKLKFIGQKFSNDASLESLYPDLLQPAILAGFKTGKTNWDDQHFMAAEAIIKDARRRNFILDRGQLFDASVFEEASGHKVAEIVYSAFGAPYVDHASRASKRFQEEMNTRMMVIDANANGHLEPSEITRKSGYMTR
jgi:hypothetical protein